MSDQAETALREWGIIYTKQPDGSLFVPGDLDISYHNLARLPDLTKVTVGGSFFCNDNQLTSLEHAPATVNGSFYCSGNLLTSLEHAPQKFKMLSSDFGEFSSWDQVPLHLRTSPETKARQQLEWRNQIEDMAKQITGPHAPIEAPHRATFKKRLSPL